jgi:hypothetical protein
MVAVVSIPTVHLRKFGSWSIVIVTTTAPREQNANIESVEGPSLDEVRGSDPPHPPQLFAAEHSEGAGFSLAISRRSKT